MPRNSTTGAYTAPSNSVNPAVDNEIISAPDFNDLRDDIAEALAHTDATTRALYPTMGQIQDGKPTWGGTATGTTSAIVVTLTPVPTAIVAGMEVAFLMGASANAAAATLDIGITAGAPPVAVTYPIRRVDGTAIQAGDLAAGAMVTLRCDGTGFRVHSIVQGDIRNTLGTTVRTTDATLVNADNAFVQDCTAAVTLTLDQASVLTAGWWSYVRNNSTSAVTLWGYRAADQAVNGDFSSGTTGWTLGTGWSVGTAGVATAASAAISQAQTLTVGALYEVTYTVVTASAGTVTLQLTGGTTVSGTARSTTGTYTEYLRAVTGNTTFGLLGAAFTGSVDNISVRKVEEIDGEATVTIIPDTMPLVWCDGTTSRLSPVSSNGNATVTSSATSITLTSTSVRVQSVTMTAAGQSVTLPAAATLTLGGPLYVIRNAGDRPFGVRSNGGALLAVVSAGGVADCYLESIATAAGQWAINGRGLEPALTLVDATLASTYTTAIEAACKLTDTVSVHFAQNSSGHLFALAVDSTPGAGAAGTPTAIDTAGTTTPVHCFRISDTQAIAFWTQSTNHKCAVLTVAGTTVSVGTVASTATAFLAQATFTGRPVLAQLTSSLYVALYGNGANAIAISVSGTTATIGTGVASGASTAQQGLAVYRISDTTALALYVDDSGTVGTPYSIRGVVLSISGASLSVGTSAGVNDVAASSALPSCQLTSNKAIVGWAQVGVATKAVVFTVTGTAVAAGTALSVEAPNVGSVTYTGNNANRFQPNLFRLSDTSALLTFGDSSGGAVTSRHVALTESAGILTAGSILYSLWSNGASDLGGNFPQAATGFLAFSADPGVANFPRKMFVQAVTASGATLSVTGTWTRGDFQPDTRASARFGLSGGVSGIFQDLNYGGYATTDMRHLLTRPNLLHLFRFRAGASPQYLGPAVLADFNVNATAGSGALNTPVEIAANRAAFIGKSLSGPDATTNSVRLLIVEFAA